LNTSSRAIFAILDGNLDAPTAFELEIAGGDIIFLFVFGTFYFFLIFLVESAGTSNLVNKLLKRETTIAYVPKEFDDDV